MEVRGKRFGMVERLGWNFDHMAAWDLNVPQSCGTI